MVCVWVVGRNVRLTHLGLGGLECRLGIVHTCLRSLQLVLGIGQRRIGGGLAALQGSVAVLDDVRRALQGRGEPDGRSPSQLRARSSQTLR